MQMIARGKNASDLFPAVVKNVACKNIEVCISTEVLRLSPEALVRFFCILKFTVNKVYIRIEVLFLISERRMRLGFI